jgi:hypothetical protein
MAVDGDDPTGSVATGIGREGLCEGWSLVRRNPTECVCVCVCVRARARVCVCVCEWVSEWVSV